MFTKPKSIKIVILLLLATLLITSGFKCGAAPAGLTLGKPAPITLTYWSVFEEGSNVSDMITAYQKLHPHVTIDYKNFTYEEYEEQLLNAFAEDRGPDLFSINTTWMRKYQPKISSLPATVTIPYQVERGTIKKETYTENRTQATLSLRDIRTLFPDVVYDNQIIDGQIYALPLSIDTMALFYNRDLLNNAGISVPPKTWDDFSTDVIKLTKQDNKGNIIQAGAAIGTADNVARSTDLLSLLMMQNGTPMTNDSGYATFNTRPQNYTSEASPGDQALNYYTSYASPATQVYTWNSAMPNSLTSFMNGKAAFYFGYSYNIATIKAQAPKLNFEITTVPQVSTIPVNFANYWAEAVSKKSVHQNEAWDFIMYMAANKDNNKIYLAQSHKPAALRELISTQQNDLELAPFVSQVLTAKSWYKGKNAIAAEKILKQMIRDNLAGSLPTEQILSLAVQKINQTY
jgi:multiple sugar transport system substrate-binding protein